MLNRWFTKYLWIQNNGVENLPKSWVVREAATCPPRQTTVTGDQAGSSTTLTVASTAPFTVGQQLTIPVTSATGTVSNVTPLITNIPDATHVTIATAVAAAGSKVAGGATSASPATPPTRRRTPSGPIPPRPPVVQKLAAGGATRGALSLTARPAARSRR